MQGLRTAREHPQLLLIGNPDDRRTTMFQAAMERHSFPAPLIASYRELLANGGDLSSWLSQDVTHVRLDSPGVDDEVWRELVAWGEGGEAPAHIRRIEADAARRLTPELGRIRYAHQWFLGFSRFLRRLDAQLYHWPSIRQLRPAEQILAMFDKVAAHQRLTQVGVPGPHRLEGGEDVDGYDALRALMEHHNCRRVFVKLRTGSSASGVVAYRVQGAREEAVTSVEVVSEGGEIRLYNSLRIRRYQRMQDVRALFDALLPEGAVVERWIPKASVQGRSSDLRVVLIAGEARHVVLRLSRSPMTNLHLGNQRGDVPSLQREVGVERWAHMMAVAASSIDAFPGFHCAGVDLVCASGFRHPLVLEINAFGDLLPGIVHRGEDTYGAQLLAL